MFVILGSSVQNGPFYTVHLFMFLFLQNLCYKVEGLSSLCYKRLTVGCSGYERSWSEMGPIYGLLNQFMQITPFSLINFIRSKQKSNHSVCGLLILLHLLCNIVSQYEVVAHTSLCMQLRALAMQAQYV